VLGEEDPGASLELLRNQALKSRAQAAKAHEANPYLTINCSNNGQCFTIQVQWQEGSARAFTDLLGLVIAEHAEISEVAWLHHRKTGQDPVQLEMGRAADGRAAVQVKAPAVLQAGSAAPPRRKVLHEPFVAANDHVPYGLQQRQRK
jgi:hypothetical protein